MSPRLRALAAITSLLAGAVWFSQGAPRLEAALLTGRAERLRSRSVSEVDAIWAALATRQPELLPDAREAARQQAWRTELSAVQQAEKNAIRSIWGTLTPAQRREGPGLIATLPPLHYDGDSRFAEPEPPSLAAALIARHGFFLIEGVVAVPVEAGLAHQKQLLAVLALVETGEFSGEQAASILTVVLELITLQRRKKILEEQLAAQLPADLQSVSRGVSVP